MLSAKTFRFEMLLVSIISLLKEGFAVGCTKYAFGRTMCINLFIGVENEHISKQGCSSIFFASRSICSSKKGLLVNTLF